MLATLEDRCDPGCNYVEVCSWLFVTSWMCIRGCSGLCGYVFVAIYEYGYRHDALPPSHKGGRGMIDVVLVTML